MVPFGKKVALGVIIEIARSTTLPPQRVRSVLSIMRDVPPLPDAAREEIVKGLAAYKKTP